MGKRNKRLYCCGCGTTVHARLTNGEAVYPHRKDLSRLPMWKCDTCSNHVGCHRGTTQPLGNIATRELRQIRKQIHDLLDPIWQSGLIPRKTLYHKLGTLLNRKYHTAELNTMEDAERVLRMVMMLRRGMKE